MPGYLDRPDRINVSLSSHLQSDMSVIYCGHSGKERRIVEQVSIGSGLEILMLLPTHCNNNLRSIICRLLGVELLPALNFSDCFGRAQSPASNVRKETSNELKIPGWILSTAVSNTAHF